MDRTDWKFVAILGTIIVFIVALFWYDDYKAGRERAQAESLKSMPVLLPLDGVDNISVERITNDLEETWIVFHTKRQLILDKEQLNDCGGENLPGSLKPFRTALLAQNGVENVDIRAYQIVVQKGRLFAWEEVEGRVRELITKEYPCVALPDTLKPEDAE